MNSVIDSMKKLLGGVALILASVANPAHAQTTGTLPVPSQMAQSAAAKTTVREDLVPLSLKLPRMPSKGLRELEEERRYSGISQKYYEPRRPFLVPRFVRLLSLKKPVTGSDKELIIGEYPLVTDGDKQPWLGGDSLVELAPGVQWVQIDLGEPCDVYAVVLWHNFYRNSIYHDIIVRCSEDPLIKIGVRTLFNNDSDNSAGLGKGKDREYLETNEGKLIDGKDAKGKPVRTRYIRCYSNGSTWSEANHYMEVEVYGRPAPPDHKD